MKNLKNDLKNSVENLEEAIKSIEAMIADDGNYYAIDNLLQKRDKWNVELFERRIQLDIVEYLERIEEKLDRLIAEKGWLSAETSVYPVYPTIDKEQLDQIIEQLKQSSTAVMPDITTYPYEVYPKIESDMNWIVDDRDISSFREYKD